MELENQCQLSAKQQAAITALLAASSVTEAAKTACVSESTLWKWLGEPDFKQAYTEARRLTFEGAVLAMQGTYSRAVCVLMSVLESDTTPAAQKISAARILMESAFKGQEVLDTEERLSAIEATLAAHAAQEGTRKR